MWRYPLPKKILSAMLILVGKKVLKIIAGWSSLAARLAHNQQVAGSNPAPATTNAPENKKFLPNTLFFEKKIYN